MSFIRGLENRFFGTVRDPEATEVSGADAGPWDVRSLRGHKYCLLTSYRKSGKPVGTPVWFGISEERIYIRSGAQDGKVKRIRRNAEVLVSPCTARGGPLGRPMAGRARILEPREYTRAEDALRQNYGLGRKLYRLVRRRIDVAYLEVGPADGPPSPDAP